MENLFIYTQEVQDAINNSKPIVALESTIITHGMEYPYNFETASSLEDIIKKQNCIPATICIIQGKIHIGLNKEQLQSISQAKDFIKVSTNNLSYVLANKLNGSTTVATTSKIANLAKIKFFATGGIGGVHRDFQNSLDISNDLVELGSNQMCVISSGVKSILDIPKTLEFLETMGVGVYGYKTEEFPAFFTRKSNCYVKQVNDDKEISNICKMQFDILNIKKCILIANPIPLEFEADGQEIEIAVQQSLKELEEQKIVGKDITPFLLKRIGELTNNRSVSSNIKLVKNNALIAAKIAYSYYNQQILKN